MTDLLFGFSVLVWAAILASCFPGLWPRRVHEWIDGHPQIDQEQLTALAVVRSGTPSHAITGPLCSTLLEQYNAAVFLKRLDRTPEAGTHLRFRCRRERDVLVWAAASQDDVYIVLRRRGSTRRAYFARQPDLYRYLTQQQWRVSGGARRARLPGPAHLRRVR